MKNLKKYGLLVGLVALLGYSLLMGCATVSKSDAASGSQSITAQASNQEITALPQLAGKAKVVMEVRGGSITIAVDGENAPITAGNFVDLVNRGLYNNLMFHRVVREPQPFVVQGGDPDSKNTEIQAEQLGTGSFVDPVTNRPRYIPLEIKPRGAEQPIYSKTLGQAKVTTGPVLRHLRGAVAMARAQMPDSASSQFYFALADLSFLDGDYAVFGYVTEGMDVVDQIQQGDRIQSARVVEGLENLQASSSTYRSN